MTDIAAHVRIFEPAPTDDFVEKRAKAVKDLAARFKKDNNIDVLIGVSDGLAKGCLKGGAVPDPLAEQIESVIRQHSTAFVRDGNALQVLTIGLLALDQLVTTAKPGLSELSIFDVLAHSAWLALARQPTLADPKLETLRAQVLANARNLSLRSASKARTRIPPPDFAIDKLSTDGTDFNANLKAALDVPLGALRNNAALDREEIDFLWWALGDFSDSLNLPYSSVEPPVAAVAAGLDASGKLRRLPADAHRHIVYRQIPDGGAISLKQLVEATSPHSERLTQVYGHDRIKRFPQVFNVLAALAKETTADGRTKLPLRDWAARILLEAGFLRVIALLPGAKV